VPHSGEKAATFTDTSPRARARYLERLRETAPVDRLARAFALSRRVRELTMADVERQHPGASARELKIAFVRRVYGERLAERLAKRLP
jgi:hypothetical protein